MPGHTNFNVLRDKMEPRLDPPVNGIDLVWCAGHSLMCLRLTRWWQVRERFYWWRLSRKDTKKAIAYYRERREGR